MPVSELRRRDVGKRRWSADVRLGGLVVGDTRIEAEEPIEIDLVVEPVSGGATVAGLVHSRWVGPCSRCLEPITGDIDVEVHAVFASGPVGDGGGDDDDDDDSYELGSEELDLEPMVRDALLLDLPQIARCPHAADDPCPLSGYSPSAVAGPSDEPGEEETAVDPRWAALSELRLDEADDPDS